MGVHDDFGLQRNPAIPSAVVSKTAFHVGLNPTECVGQDKCFLRERQVPFLCLAGSGYGLGGDALVSPDHLMGKAIPISERLLKGKSVF